MILISHSEINTIVQQYAIEINKEFLEKKQTLLEVIDLLSFNTSVNKKMVAGNVIKYTSALKLILNVKDLNKPKKIVQNKDTEVLVFNINKNQIRTDKRSECRKKARFKEINNQLDIIFKTHNLIDLFSAKPADLKKINSLYPIIDKPKTRLYNYFFDYQNYYDLLNKLISERLGLVCCPYCNRNYITYVYTVKGKRIVGPTYDHFFNKGTYKFLTVSFYNLIPSCYVCNSNLKNQINFDLSTHLHPYLDNFGDNATFDFNLSLLNNGLEKKIVFQPSVKLNIGISDEEKLKLVGKDVDVKGEVTGSIKVFKLNEIYETHHDTVEEIHVKFDKNSPHYIKSIKDKLDKLGVSEDEFYRFHFNNYYHPEDFHKKPLSKLTKDIYNKMKQIQPL